MALAAFFLLFLFLLWFGLFIINAVSGGFWGFGGRPRCGLLWVGRLFFLFFFLFLFFSFLLLLLVATVAVVVPDTPLFHVHQVLVITDVARPLMGGAQAGHHKEGDGNAQGGD